MSFKEKSSAWKGPFDKANAALSTSTRQTDLLLPGTPPPIELEVPISQLPLAGLLSGGEMVPIVQNGITCRSTTAIIGSGGEAPVLINKTITLAYSATIGQTVFSLSIPDHYGRNYALTDQKALQVTVGGVRYIVDDGSGTWGQYTVDLAANTVTLLRPFGADPAVIVGDGDFVIFDIFSLNDQPTSTLIVGSGLWTQSLTPTAVNTFPALTLPANGQMTIMYVNGRAFSDDSVVPSFNISGHSLSWVDPNYSVYPTDNVVITYTYDDTSSGGDSRVGIFSQHCNIMATNILPDMSVLPDGQMIIVYVNGVAFFDNSVPPSFTLSAYTITWVDPVYSIVPGDNVVVTYTYGGSTSGGGGGVPEAPLDNRLYGRENAAWVAVPSGLSDAPNDGTAYARKSLGWSHLAHTDITDWAASVPAGSSTPPVMDGTATVGTGVTWARADHIHPTDASLYPASNPAGYQTAAQITASLGGYLPLVGGTVTGNVTMQAAQLIQNQTVADLTVTHAANTITGQLNGLNKAVLHLGSDRFENGFDEGSSFSVDVYSDAGSLYKNIFEIYRDGSVICTGATLAVTDSNGTFAGTGSTLGISSSALSPASGQMVIESTCSDTGAGWLMKLGDGSSRTGANAGVNFTIIPVADNGANLAVALTITRSTGIVSFGKSPTAPTPVNTDSSTNLATTAFARGGVSTNSNAAAGQIGEVISSNITAGVSIATSGTPVNVTSISLTAGDWDVAGEVWVAVGTGGATVVSGAINTTTGALPAASSLATARITSNVTVTASTTEIVSLRPCRVSLASTTTYFLVASATFPSGTVTATGNIIARRAR